MHAIENKYRYPVNRTLWLHKAYTCSGYNVVFVIIMINFWHFPKLLQVKTICTNKDQRQFWTIRKKTIIKRGWITHWILKSMEHHRYEKWLFKMWNQIVLRTQWTGVDTNVMMVTEKTSQLCRLWWAINANVAVEDWCGMGNKRRRSNSPRFLCKCYSI